MAKTTITAYYGRSKTGLKKDRVKMLLVEGSGSTTKIVADSTDMARLWRKARKNQGDQCKLDAYQ